MDLASRTLIGLALAALVLAPTGCGGSSSDGGGSDPATCNAPFSTTLSGTWFVEETVSVSSGGCGASQSQFSTFLTQTDSRLVFLGQTTFSATLCGSRATNDYDFSVPVSGGLRTYRNLVIAYSSETAFTGTAQWDWDSGTNTCSGTSTFTGTR